ncbi:hypothetical protein [Clostridium sp.]|uniref:hypothetical protein n=1 Tax=Clostridium sp. TaxID=1506 RepID=UPI0026DAF340|nr:hypothetical protein [Clostridium sp.]MDO5038703.1 hypothetical protein [Clostridium sp.]
MKPDKKYMYFLEEDEPIFETFNIDSSFRNLSSGFSPNVDSIKLDNFLNFDNKLPEGFGFQFDLRKQAIEDALGKNNELYCYNKAVSTELENEFNVPIPTEILRNFDMDLDENDLIDICNDNKFRPVPQNKCNPNEIFEKIRVNNPMILKTMQSYRIPFPIAKTLIKRIIKLTNMYCYRE